jgi:anti-sigma factor RsiW
MIIAIHGFVPKEIMALHDGELTADRAQEVAAHIDTCAECRNLAGMFSATSQSLAAWTIREAPESLQASTGRHSGIAGEDNPSVFLYVVPPSPRAPNFGARCLRHLLGSFL